MGRRGRILGAAIVGAHAGELILPWVLAVEGKLRLGDLAAVIAPYPTLSEVTKRAAGSLVHATPVQRSHALARPPPGTARMSARRLAPLAVLAVLATLVYGSGLHEQLELRHPAIQPRAGARYGCRLGLAQQPHVRRWSTPWRRRSRCPGGLVLTVTAGFLFGTLGGGLTAVVGATLGAVAVFLIARTALGEPLRARAGPWLGRMEAGFRENALSYLLVLRLVPIFPFWLVNLVPAFLGVPLATYALGTFLGIMPATFVFASVGSGLGAVFDRGEEPDLGLVFEPRVLLPLLGLAVLALPYPPLYKRWRQRQAASSG